MADWFGRAATATATWCSQPIAFVAHLAVIGAWLVGGQRIDGSIDLLTMVLSIEAILLALLILNTANRNAAAMHLKMDELVRATESARTRLAGEHLETATEKQILVEQRELERLVKEDMDCNK